MPRRSWKLLYFYFTLVVVSPGRRKQKPKAVALIPNVKLFCSCASRVGKQAGRAQAVMMKVWKECQNSCLFVCAIFRFPFNIAIASWRNVPLSFSSSCPATMLVLRWNAISSTSRARYTNVWTFSNLCSVEWVHIIFIFAFNFAVFY